MSEMINVEELFASKVFTRATMRERLPKNVYKEVLQVMDRGGELSPAGRRCGSQGHEGLGC